MKTYPGATKGNEGEEGDLDALLSGVATKKAADVKKEDGAEGAAVKAEEGVEGKVLSATSDGDAPSASVKQEDGAEEISAPPVVVFKKRKVKK